MNNTTGFTGGQIPGSQAQMQTGMGTTGVLSGQIPQSTLQQHAALLQGQSYPTTGALGQGGLNQGMQNITQGMAGLTHGTQGIQGIQPGMQGLTQGVPFGTGVTPGFTTGVPTGLATGTVPLVATEGPAYGMEGLAGHSHALAQNLGTQGNIVGTPIGTTTGLVQTNVLPTHNVPGNTTAQGQFIFRPLEGKFIKDGDLIGKQDPYIKIKLGWHSAKSSVAQGAGLNPTWADSITLPRKHNETFAKMKVKDKDRLRKDDRLGDVKINLDEIVQKGRVTQWYPIANRKGVVAGEILMDIEYAPLFISR